MNTTETLPSLAEIEQRLKSLEDSHTEATNALNLLVFSGERDKLLAAFVMATGAAASGLQVRMFFTFWATAALRKSKAQFGKKSFVERAFGWMLPGGVKQTKLSNMDMAGAGRQLMALEMKKKGVADLPQLIDVAAELDVQIQVCEMSMQLMGIKPEELIDYPSLDYCGVATFVDQASSANTTLFI